MKSTLAQNPTHDLTFPLCFPPGWKVSRLALSQFFSGFILSYCVLDSSVKNFTPYAFYSQCTYIALSMFFTFVLFGQLSGGQGNPIITLALIFNKGANMNLIKCLICIVAQYAGCFVGGAVAYGTVRPIIPPGYNSSDVPLLFGNQLVGTFMFICLYFMIMSAATRFQSNFWCYFLVPMAYYISMMVTYQYTGFNPVSSLSSQLYYGILYGQWEPLQTYWAFICGPVVGSLIASVFMNFFVIPLYKSQQAAQNKS